MGPPPLIRRGSLVRRRMIEPPLVVSITLLILTDDASEFFDRIDNSPWRSPLTSLRSSRSRQRRSHRTASLSRAHKLQLNSPPDNVGNLPRRIDNAHAPLELVKAHGAQDGN
jgi:hypothetical protein